MSPPTRKHEFATWHLPGRSPVIVYSKPTMEHIVTGVVAGYQTFPSGGFEIGGVLFGTADASEIRVTATRQIHCDHAHGPDFVLSDADEERLRLQIEKYSEDPELHGLVPVGWFHSHTRSDIFLSERDIRVWNRFFPLPWQVSLVLRPKDGEATLAGFFFRPRFGRPRVESSYLIFEAGPIVDAAAGFTPASQSSAKGSPLPEPDIADNVTRLAEVVKNPPAPSSNSIEDDLVPYPPMELFRYPQERKATSRKLWPWLLVAAAALSGVGFLAVPWYQKEFMAKPVPELGLRFEYDNGQLRAAWDPNSPWVQKAGRGILRITDQGAPPIDFPLSRRLLDSGRWPLVQKSADTEVLMELEVPGVDPKQERVFEVVRILGKIAKADAPAPDLVSLQIQMEGLQETLRQETKSNDDLEEELRQLREQLVAKKEPSPTPSAGLGADPAQPVAAEPPPRLPSLAPPPAPALQTPSPVEPAGPAFADRIPPRVINPLPPPEPAKPEPYTGPTSGKIIWTGFLGANSTLNIDGRRTTTGSVNSALPGAPVRITVYPAEFTSGGLSVYSGEAKHSRGTVEEPKSAQNGWMNTKYTYDPARAREAQVVARPNPASGYRQIQVKSGDRPLSVLVIEWEVAQ